MCDIVSKCWNLNVIVHWLRLVFGASKSFFIVTWAASALHRWSSLSRLLSSLCWSALCSIWRLSQVLQVSKLCWPKWRFIRAVAVFKYSFQAHFCFFVHRRRHVRKVACQAHTQSHMERWYLGWGLSDSCADCLFHLSVWKIRMRIKLR